MTQTPCPQEDAVARAARTGVWNAALSQHARECPACAEIAAFTRSLNEMAGQPEGAAALPEASLLWWKHELMERYRRRKRAQRPLEVMDAVSAMLALIAAAAVLVMATSLAQEMVSLAARNAPRLVLATVTGGSSGSLLHAVWLGTVVALGASAALLYPLLKE